MWRGNVLGRARLSFCLSVGMYSEYLGQVRMSRSWSQGRGHDQGHTSKTTNFT